MRKLREALGRQMRANRTKNLLFSEAARILEIDPTFIAAVEELVGPGAPPIPEARLADLVSWLADCFVERIYGINQYIQVNSEARKELTEIYRMSWQKISETGDAVTTIRGFHHPRIIEWLRRVYPRALARELRGHERIGEVVCQEYSPELQIRLFGLELRTMKQPVLDLGCGASGRLVAYLRESGIEAYGLDRTRNENAPFVRAGDWLAPDAPQTWGTIVSNMAFTNHFVFVRTYDARQVPRYERRYMNILDSLRAGGAFHYAPDVPELEALIDPTRFILEKRLISGRYGASKVTRAG